MGIFDRFWSFVSPNTKVRILLVGLDNSGKTTILNHMKPKKATLNTVPTVGFTEEKFAKNGIEFNAIDMSGQGKYRNLWEQYYDDCEGIIFVIDSTDKLRFAVAKDELDMMLEKLKGKTIPIVIFANKQDCPGSATAMECMASLSLQTIQDKPWQIFASDALHGEGLQNGVDWLVKAMKELKSRQGAPGTAS